ncbi:hypothetical protein GGI20_005890 [Coemansia sp. BCRC 34301]|nr:hypothetical protein GGI20_005890 [Coemansia sp. BCRC 34301]
MHHLELIASKASAQQYRHTASASKEALKGVDAELFDDPIDEFLTQDVAAGLLTAVSQSNKNKSQCNRSSSSSPVQPGTSQWYHDNHDIYIGVGGDSQKPMDIRQDPGQEHANESYVSESYANESYASVDDGDSPPQSPLEGFCDLRVFSGTGGGDMDIYLNQFGPTVRDTSQQPGGSRDRSRGGRRGRGGARSHPRSSSSSNSSGLTRGGRRGRGRGRGPVQQATAAGFGGIRPVTSARALAPAVTTPIIYNHYADDGYLDIAPSLNWEGGGMSRFG